MNVNINSPEVIMLRRAVESRSGVTPHLLADYERLSSIVSDNGRELLSQSTIERVWQYSTRKSANVSTHTLDVLARYVGNKDWADFLRANAENSERESEEFAPGPGLTDTSMLPEGATVRLKWLPNRVMTVRHMGKGRFEVLESLNSSIRPGDSFVCMQMQSGQPLFLDYFVRNEPPGLKKETNSCAAPRDSAHEMTGRYVIGRNSGLTSFETDMK